MMPFETTCIALPEAGGTVAASPSGRGVPFGLRTISIARLRRASTSSTSLSASTGTDVCAVAESRAGSAEADEVVLSLGSACPWPALSALDVIARLRFESVVLILRTADTT
jgi:hypothetical protein